MPSKRPNQRFRDIVENIDAIISYAVYMGKEQFIADRLRYDATERCLSRISEAAIKLGMLAEELAPNQPWNDIRGLGNWLRHDYPNVIKTVIWKTVSRDLKPLRACIESS